MPEQPKSRLGLVGKLAQEGVQPQVRAVSRGETLTAPIVVELDPTSFCDLACPECISGELLQSGRFERKRLLDLVSEFVAGGVKAVILIGGGEPLLHPATPEAIERLSDGGISVGLTTNGTMLRRYAAVIGAHVAWTRVSVDAATPETYMAFRPHRGRRTDVFDNVIDGMRHLVESGVGAVGYSFLVMTRRESSGTWITNGFEIERAARLARDIGCDYFEVKPEYDLAHYVQGQPDSVREAIVEQMRNAKDLVDDGFAVIWPDHFNAMLDGEELNQPKSYTTCPTLELRTLVTSSGAYVCPYHRGNARGHYGDPTEESFAGLWTDEKRAGVAASIDPSRDCSFHCIRHGTNEEIFRLARGGKPPEPVANYDLFI